MQKVYLSLFLICSVLLNHPCAALAASSETKDTRLIQVQQSAFLNICPKLSEQKIIECSVAIGDALVLKTLLSGCEDSEFRFKYSKKTGAKHYAVNLPRTEEYLPGREQVHKTLTDLLSDLVGSDKHIENLKALCSAANKAAAEAKSPESSDR